MKNKEFDQHIRQQLESIQPDKGASSWVAFESLLDSELNDVSFDHHIKEKVENIEQPYQESHWNLFLSHFAWVQLFTKDLIYNKVFEAVLLVLALAFVFPQQTTTYDAYNISSTGVYPVEDAYSFFNNGEEEKTAIKIESTSESELATEYRTFLVERERNSDAGEFINENPGYFEYSLMPTAYSTNEEVQLLNAGLFKLDFERKMIDHVPAYSAQEDHTRVNQLPFNDFRKLVSEAVSINPGSFNVLSNNSLSNSRTIVSVFTTMDINTIHTPFDDIYLRNGYEQSKFGVGGGFSIGWNKNRWTLETGMLFSMKQYNPRTVLEIFRFNPNSETAEAISLRAIELNTLSIPLHLRFDVYQGGRFTPYLLAGVGLNLATHANYDREQFKIALAQPLPPDTQVNPGSTPRLDEKKFSDGIIQGGSFSENYFLSFNSGFGLDYQMGKKWRLFAEMSYHYNFMKKELGPNNDRINTFSFKLGGRHILQK